MHVFNFSFLSKYKLYFIIIAAVIVAIILMVIAFSSVIKLPIDDILKSSDVFKATSYYAEYEITEISNKNRNIYTMNETYKKEENNEYFKFGYKDFVGNEVTYIVANDKVKVSNSSQLNSYILNSNTFKKTNLFSLATYIDIINSIGSSGCKCFILKVSEEDNIKKYELILNRKNCEVCSNKCNCKHSDLFAEGLKLSRMELLILDNKPIDITIYTLDNNAYINIKYKSFELNNKVSSDIFKF